LRERFLGKRYLYGPDLPAGIILGQNAGNELVTGLSVHPFMGSEKDGLTSVDIVDQLGFSQDLCCIKTKAFLVGLYKTIFACIVDGIGKISVGRVVSFFQVTDRRIQIG
jgi:hypothetical protein